MSRHKSLPLAIVLSLLLFATLACGTSAGAASPTAKPPSTNVQKCGMIGVRPGGKATVNPAGAARSAGNCFWRAYQQCRAASLVVSFGGVDTITTHTFGVRRSNTACAIADAVQYRVIPQPARNGGTFLCRSLARTANELRFSGCGMNGDIVVLLG
jgi:hypothetical protein